MKLLVTGGCGFIGSAFCRRLIATGTTLVNLDILYPCSTRELQESSGNYTFVKGDVKDRRLLDELLRVHEIDTVVHFAAQSHVDTSFTNPMLYTQDNVVGTHTLLEACRDYGLIVKFIHISTDEVYGENVAEGAFSETSLLKPTNPYAASKAAAEMFVHSYVHSYSFPAIIIRSNNIYGIGQYDEKVIPKFAFQLLDGKKLTIQGSGQQLRSFLHVEDAVDAVLCVLEKGSVGAVYNISSEDEISIRDLASRMIGLLKPGDPVDQWISFIADRNFNDKRYLIESEPLKQLGWKQLRPFDKGLVETVNWYKKVDRSYWIGADLVGLDLVGSKQQVVLLWGSKGWIGSQFAKVLEAKGFTAIGATSRADNRLSVLEEIDHVKPDHLVCMIGRTHGLGFTTIDYLEQEGKLKENLQDNLYAPLTLASVSKCSGIPLLYMGTGCIFESVDGLKPFTESDPPNFFGSAYSTVKGITDRILTEQYADTCLNVRIRMPISSEDCERNFISKIIQYTHICSIPNSMTVLDDVLPCLADCMSRGVRGTLNAVNPGLIDHSTILGLYRDLQNKEHTWTEISNKELVGRFVKGKRSNNELDTSRLEQLFPHIPHIRESVYRILTENKFKGRTKYHIRLGS
jgi:dTDP-glucose 4,6-dehydratase